MTDETQFSRKYQRRHRNHNSPRPANIQPGKDQRLHSLWVTENRLGLIGAEHFHPSQVERRLGGLLPFSGMLHASFKSFRKHVVHICAEGLSYFPTFSSKTGQMNYTQCHCSSHISNHLIHANFVNIFPYNFSKGKHLFPPPQKVHCIFQAATCLWNSMFNQHHNLIQKKTSTDKQPCNNNKTLSYQHACLNVSSLSKEKEQLWKLHTRPKDSANQIMK